jgi:cell division protein FtsI/penicillin-binding protein 2
MCNLVSIVANNGVSYRPHLVREIVDPLRPSISTSIQPEILNQVPVGPDFWNTMKTAMVDVVERGTGQKAKIPGIVWGGKTGSTEHGNKKITKTHAWFVGIAPMDHPKIAICVLLEDGGHGGDAAAPIAQEVVQHYLLAEPAALAKAAAKTLSASAASSAVARSPVATAAR